MADHGFAIGKYRIEKEIGRGASSVVYLAYDPFHRRNVAVKQIHAHLLKDDALAARYRRSLRNEGLIAGQVADEPSADRDQPRDERRVGVGEIAFLDQPGDGVDRRRRAAHR